MTFTTQKILVEAEVLWPNGKKDEPDYRFRKPNTKLIRAVRSCQESGAQVIVMCSTNMSVKVLSKMLDTYGIKPVHIAGIANIRGVLESAKQALFYRHKPGIVYECQAVFAAWARSQGATVIMPSAHDSVSLMSTEDAEEILRVNPSEFQTQFTLNL